MVEGSVGQLTVADSNFMQRALSLARSAGKACSPNPRVGCVLTDAGGRIIGEGHTQAVGGPHAEVMALRDAASKGFDTAGATAYVTLEPCSHQGRTGPCCDALIRAGVRRVVASCEDPNPLVRGQGFDRLRRAGIVVEVGCGASESQDLNLGFFSRMQRGRPWVRVKIAASLDGISALSNGASQWITSVEARQDGHRWRSKADVILTGIGTVLADNPRLDVRSAEPEPSPPLAIIDRRLRTPADAALFQANRPVWIYTTDSSQRTFTASVDRVAQIVTAGSPNDAKVDLGTVMNDLAHREVNEVHVEAGAKLNGSLLRAGLVDELVVYLAPRLLGAGRGMMDLPALKSLQDGLHLQFLSITPVGPDVRLVARVV